MPVAVTSPSAPLHQETGEYTLLVPPGRVFAKAAPLPPLHHHMPCLPVPAGPGPQAHCPFAPAAVSGATAASKVEVSHEVCAVRSAHVPTSCTPPLSVG